MQADRYIGAGFFILGVVMTWDATRIAFPMLGTGDPGPRVLPMVLGVLIAVLGAILCLRRPEIAAGEAAQMEDADTATIIPAEPLLFQVLHTLNLLVYAVFFERLGFSLSTFAFLVIAIFLLGARTLRGGIVAVAAAAAVTLVVGTGLKLGVGVPLPGVLFG